MGWELMKQRKQQGSRRIGLVARLVQAQLAMSSLGASVYFPTAEDRWPARLIHAGAVLLGVGVAMLATWLRRRL
jgi:hypothetical protein